MPTHLLAIDQGSQSTKVTIVDDRGHPLVEVRRQLRPYDTSVRGRAVHPDDDLWDSLAATCREAMARYPGDPGDIVGVGLCTIRFCRAYLDADGLLTEPVLSWMDDRAHLPFPGADSRVRYVTTSSGYLGHRLTGAFLDTSANYAGMWPIDQTSADWSADPTAFAETGMPRELLFDLVEPGARLGEITPAASRATGIPAGLPVVATANDKAVEALGSGLRDESSVLLSLGTYIAAMAVGSSPSAGGDAYWVNSASEPGRYLYESNGIRRGMWTVTWFRSLLEAPAGSSADSALELTLDREAASVPPGCDGLFALLDWLAPGQAPYRRGALLGFNGSQGRGHIHRSILEGISLTMRDHTTAMESALHRDHASLAVTGGGSRSNLMMQIVADTFDRPVHRLAMPDAAGLGAAICASVGLGVHPGWDEATAAMVRTDRIFTPDPDAVRAYRAINEVYRELTTYTDPLFRRTGAVLGYR